MPSMGRLRRTIWIEQRVRFATHTELDSVVAVQLLTLNLLPVNVSAMLAVVVDDVIPVLFEDMQACSRETRGSGNNKVVLGFAAD